MVGWLVYVIQETRGQIIPVVVVIEGGRGGELGMIEDQVESDKVTKGRRKKRRRRTMNELKLCKR